MEEYWNDPANTPAEEPEEPVESEQLFDEAEPEVFEEPPKPKKKKKKVTFKKKVRRLIRRFFKLPLVTRIIAGVVLVAVIALIVVLIVLLPKGCDSTRNPAANAPSASPTAEVKLPENTPSAPTDTPAIYTSAPTNTPTPKLTQTVKPNERDAIVPYIRTRLVELGYMEMPQTNDELYDTATINAVKRFQYRNFPDNNKEWDGYIGQKTFDKMFGPADEVKAFYMKSGDTDKKLYDGELVTKMQKQLVALSYLKSTTGSYDSATVNAVRTFQKENSITSDGVAGQDTLKLLAAKVEALETAPADTPVITDTETQPQP